MTPHHHLYRMYGQLTRVVIGVLFSIGLLMSCVVMATESETQAEIMTEADAIRLAFDRSHKCEYLETDVDIARFRLESAGMIENPELRLRNVLNRSDSEENGDLRMGLRWKPPRFGELKEEKREAEVDVSDREIDYIRYRDELTRKVREAYADVVRQDTLADLAACRLDLETTRLALIEKMVNLGRRSVVYLTKAKMWLTESRHELTQCVNRKKAARRKLAEWTGSSEEMKVTCEDIREVDHDLEALIGIACEHRPEIDSAVRQTELAMQRSRVDRLAIIPQPTFFDVSYDFDDNQDERVELRMGIEIPLFNWNRGNIKASDRVVQRKMDKASAVREQIADDLRDAYEVYADALTDWQSFNKDLDEMMSDTRTVIRQAGDHDVLAPDEVLELDLVLIETQRILAEKRYNLAEALADLFFEMGVDGFESIAAEAANVSLSRR